MTVRGMERSNCGGSVPLKPAGGDRFSDVESNEPSETGNVPVSVPFSCDFESHADSID